MLDQASKPSNPPSGAGSLNGSRRNSLEPDEALDQAFNILEEIGV